MVPLLWRKFKPALSFAENGDATQWSPIPLQALL
jgi:hypothetical protein